jgi:hypothetical protein
MKLCFILMQLLFIWDPSDLLGHGQDQSGTTQASLPSPMWGSSSCSARHISEDSIEDFSKKNSLLDGFNNRRLLDKGSPMSVEEFCGQSRDQDSTECPK